MNVTRVHAGDVVLLIDDGRGGWRELGRLDYTLADTEPLTATARELVMRLPDLVEISNVDYEPVESRASVKRAVSRAAHAEHVARARARRWTSAHEGTRHGFAQAARLPCYRGTRTR